MRRGELAGAREEPSSLGTAVFDERFPLRHDSNYLFLERPAAMAEVRAELARLGLPVAVAPDESLVPDADPTHRGLVMVHRGPRRAPSRPAGPVPLAEVAPLRRKGILSFPWGSPEVADQLIAARADLATRMSVTHFAALDKGEIVAYADLYADGDEGQIEEVATLPEHQRAGHGTDVVLTALAAAPGFVSLVADAEDWPREWYARLGFETVGTYLKLSAGP